MFNRYPEVAQQIKNKIVQSIYIDPDFNSQGALIIDFTDGSSGALFDEEDNSWVSRYITTDDNLSDLVGKTIIDISEAGHQVDPDSFEDTSNGLYRTEYMFIKITTSDGDGVTLTHYNEHNGNYSGFVSDFVWVKQ